MFITEHISDGVVGERVGCLTCNQEVAGSIMVRAQLRNNLDMVKYCDEKRKGKEEYLYSVFFAPRYTQSAQYYLQTTPCLPFLRGVHQMSQPQQLRQQTSNCSSLLIYRPRKDERLSWPSWLTYSGWLTHISGHPSATSRAQDSESTSAKDHALPLDHANLSVCLSVCLSVR